MHRVLATYDVCISVEVHVLEPLPVLNALGVSASTLQWLDMYSEKAPKVLMGSLGVNPLGMGHDTGITRPHILLTITPFNPVTSFAASCKATFTSSCKPQFCAHKTQAGCGLPNGGSAKAVTAEPIPAVGFLIGTVCGGPVNTPASLPVPLIPTQLSVYTGMTTGDIVGGIVNIGVDMLVSGLIGLAGKGLSRGNAVAELVIGMVIPWIAAIGKANNINLDVGVDNPGSIVQEAMDGDGIGSGQPAAVRVFGFGVRGSGPEGGRATGAELVGPWNR